MAEGVFLFQQVWHASLSTTTISLLRRIQDLGRWQDPQKLDVVCLPRLLTFYLRGQGKFYTLYGNTHSAGALTAWAWGVSRIIDALELTPAAGINTQKIGVTGCSRNGKGAIVAGALDERVALTIPQESGSGGAACWRLSDYQKSQGTDVQTASHIITENVWFSKNFDPHVNQVNRLPFDHHSLAGLVAPRGLFVIENTGMVRSSSLYLNFCGWAQVW